MPGRLGIGRWKGVIVGPHDEIGERQLEDSHYLIFGMIEFIPCPLTVRQIFQLAQEVALVLAGPLAGSEGRTDGAFGSSLPQLEGGELGHCLLLECLALFAPEVLPDSLLLPLLEALTERPHCQKWTQKASIVTTIMAKYLCEEVPFASMSRSANRSALRGVLCVVDLPSKEVIRETSRARFLSKSGFCGQ